MSQRYKGKRIGALVLALIMLLLCCGCGEEEQETEEKIEQGVSAGRPVEQSAAADSVFSVNYDSDAGLSPVRAVSSTNMQFWSLLYDSIFTVDENFTLSSEVVTDYSTPDNSWWVFNIDTSICFSDGTPIHASDIVYSLNQARQSSYYSGRLGLIYGISAMGSDCFAISTAYPNSQLPMLLNIPIVKNGCGGEDAPIGTGPYKLSEDGTYLEVNEYSRKADSLPVDKVYLKDFTDTASKISAFEDSRIDIVTNDPTGMYDLGYGSNNEKRYYDTSNLHYIGFNMESNFFANSAARYAVSYAVDKDYIVSELMDECGTATALPVLPGLELYDSEYASKFSYDLEKSLQLFDAANVKDHDDDGVLEFLVTGIVVEINIDFIVNNNSTVKLHAARKLAEDLTSIGIKTTLRELSWDDYMTALEEGTYDMYYGEVRLAADWDLSYLFADKNEDDIGMNYGRFTDGQYAALYKAYLAADSGFRVQSFKEAARYVTETAAIVPVCFEKRQVLTHRGVVSGIAATQYDIFNKFSEWTIDLK